MQPQDDRYRTLGEIARGRMGTVIRAIDDTLGREVAIKLSNDPRAAEPAALNRFIVEAGIAAQLQHPGIVPMHDVGVLPDGRPFMVMKLVKGNTLAVLLEERPDPTNNRESLLGVFEFVCQAVAYAHSRGVVHRDLEPGNVMIGQFGEVQLLDWGLALVDPEKHTGPVSQEDCRLGSEFGMPAYTAPEQARGEAVDYRVDVFGLGGSLCHILTGEPPYTGVSADAVKQKSITGDVGDAIARLNGCRADPRLVALAIRCLQPRPEKRPADAREVASLVAEARAEAERSLR